MPRLVITLFVGGKHDRNIHNMQMHEEVACVGTVEQMEAASRSVHLFYWSIFFCFCFCLHQLCPFSWLVCLRHTNTHAHILHLLTFLPSCSHFSDLQQEYYNVSALHKSRWQGRAALHLSTETPHFLFPPPSFYYTPPRLHSFFCLPRSLGDRHMAPHQRRRTSTAALSPGCVFLNFPLIGMSITTQQWALCALFPRQQRAFSKPN